MNFLAMYTVCTHPDLELAFREKKKRDSDPHFSWRSTTEPKKIAQIGLTVW